jgi:GAF domain-containing protein
MGIELVVTTQVLSRALQELSKTLSSLCPFSAVFRLGNNSLELIAYSDSGAKATTEIPQTFVVNLAFLEKHLDDEIKFHRIPDHTNGLEEISRFAEVFHLHEMALLAVPAHARIYGIVILGVREEQFRIKDNLQPCLSAIHLTTMALERGTDQPYTDASLVQWEALEKIGRASLSDDLMDLFREIHAQVRRLIGDYAFTAALHDEATSSIQIPYHYEEGKLSAIETFPLGEGLTTTIIHTKQPLLLNEAEKQAETFSAKKVGKGARSWMGVPLLIEDRVIGAFIVQDLERERAFQAEDLQTLTALAQQVASVLYNRMRLERSRRQVFQIQTAAQIARDISSALNLNELLLKAVNLIRERFEYYHAAVFLVDSAGKNAVIREATGEAGALMKRNGHKLAVGSKSIVGYVAGEGTPLVVNDTTKDVTHLPNPLLPNTRAEAALPLKIGDQTLGVLDVQSTIPFSFGATDIDTLQVLADQLAIAVNNTELFAETQEHLSQHRLLHHITASAASGTTLEEALKSAVNGLQVSLGGDRVSILLTDAERKTLIMKAWVGYSDEVANRIIPLGSGITGWAAAHRQTLRLDDVSRDARYIQLSPNTRSEMAIPLLFRNELLGVLNVESEQVAAYTDNDEEMLGTLAGSLAAIIANARLLEQIRKQAERERLLYEITSKIRQSTDIQTILMTTVGELSRATSARKAQITIGIKNNRNEADLER